jgi:hypothetical protein
MFPNVRLMIAATAASVVALICGFGMFAVFHVGHEPLVRLPAATAPLQLVADNGARSTASLTSSDVIDARFAVKALSHTAEAANMPVMAVELRATERHATEHLEAEPAPAAKPDAAGPGPTSSTTGPPSQEPAQEMPPGTPAETPALTEGDRPADDQADPGPSPQSEPTFSTTTAASAAAPPDGSVAEPEPSIKPPFVAVAAEDLASSPPIQVVANEPGDPSTASRKQTDPISRERGNPNAAPDGATSPTSPRPHKAAVKKPKRIHNVVRPPSAPRLIVVRYVRPRYPQAQYAPTTEQGFGAMQDPNFQTATPTQYGVAPDVRVRYLRIVVRKAAPPPTGMGGPFVRATSR